VLEANGFGILLTFLVFLQSLLEGVIFSKMTSIFVWRMNKG
jgi:hypothetical protein